MCMRLCGYVCVCVHEHGCVCVATTHLVHRVQCALSLAGLLTVWLPPCTLPGLEEADSEGTGLCLCTHYTHPSQCTRNSVYVCAFVGMTVAVTPPTHRVRHRCAH